VRLRLAGNDVVDLGDPANAGAHERARFIARICGSEERTALAAAADPGGLLWSFFAAKEAAFKLVCKLGPRPVFAHRHFAVDPALRFVRYGTEMFALSVEREGDRIHAVAWTGGERPLAIAGPIEPSADPSIAVRRLVAISLARRFGSSPAMLAIVRDPSPEAWDDLGPPRLLRCGVPLDIDVSLSHDGRFAAFAACITSEPGARAAAE
jgi:phosphopantetheinyl transferase (holo-ACP synthase)